MPKIAKSAKLAETKGKRKEMEITFKAYGLSQFAQSNETKLRAYVALALDTVATVQGWDGAEKPRSRVECEAALSIALTVDKVPETSARRIIATVKGLVTQAGKDFRDVLIGIRSAMIADGSNVGEAAAVDMMVAALIGIGAENLGFLEAYAKGGRVGLVVERAKAQAKIEELEKRAAMTAEEAKEAADIATQEAQEAADNQTPRAKAAKGVAKILEAIAKHGPLMESVELNAIVAAVAELQLARLSVANERALQDQAMAKLAKREEEEEKRALRKRA